MNKRGVGGTAEGGRQEGCIDRDVCLSQEQHGGRVVARWHGGTEGGLAQPLLIMRAVERQASWKGAVLAVVRPQSQSILALVDHTWNPLAHRVTLFLLRRNVLYHGQLYTALK